MHVGVFFGGRSPEHDISVVTGLQVVNALDPALFEITPVYLSPQGAWFIGDALRDRATYIPGPKELETLTEVALHFGAGRQKPQLSPVSTTNRAGSVKLDFAIPSFHGLQGEDGCVQGLFELANLPYSGMRVMASAILMDKIMTKTALQDLDIPILSAYEVFRPAKGLIVLKSELEAQLPDLEFPYILKPRNLGSSIGVAKVNDYQELADALPEVFRFDVCGILERFVPNLIEYNVSVSRLDGEVRTSAIERPKSASELLDFKAKYLSGGDGGGLKQPGQSSQGMLSLTRDINPLLPEALERGIERSAKLAFERFLGSGAPRIDFLSNAQTGEFWLNEVNPCPGSFGYFLWEAATPPLLFSELLEKLIDEGLRLARRARLPDDPTPAEARLFKRR
jgi:D-alanine-D-alanine ligase